MCGSLSWILPPSVTLRGPAEQWGDTRVLKTAHLCSSPSPSTHCFSLTQFVSL